MLKIYKLVSLSWFNNFLYRVLLIDSDAIFELDTVLPSDVNVESVAIINSSLVDTELTAVFVRWSKDKSSLIEPKIRTVILLLVSDAFVN